MERRCTTSLRRIHIELRLQQRADRILVLSFDGIDEPEVAMGEDPGDET